VPIVEVYADVVCPFAYVGLTRLLQRRHELGRDDVVLRIRAWPLEVVNGAPVDPDLIAEEIDEIAPQVAPELFRGFDPASFPTSSIPALALTHAGYQRSAATGEQVAMELRRLLFEERTDIADPDVLAAVGRRYAVTDPADPAAVMADHERGKELGVIGSPHFVVGGASLFCPVLDISRHDGHLRVRIDPDGFDRLAAACFS
jgi:predicted DsbA family dithiol-disulfide isomerase